MAIGISPKLPLQIDENDGFCKLIKSYEEMVKQNIHMLILTNPGERIMDINYGVGIRNFLFENTSETLLNNIESKILSQIENYFPFVEIDNIEFNDIKKFNNSNENILIIKIYYKIIPLGTNDLITISEKYN